MGVVGEPDVIDDTVFELNSYSSDDDWIIDKWVHGGPFHAVPLALPACRLAGMAAGPVMASSTAKHCPQATHHREYLKLRAAKLTGSRGRKGAPRADLKDSGTTHGIPGLMLPC